MRSAPFRTRGGSEVLRTEDVPTFNRTLGLRTLFFVVVANMIGTGIFTTSGFMMADLGHPIAVLACWAVGGLLAVCGGLCYAELGTRFPVTGGEYVFLRETFGPNWAFLSGWTSLLVGFSAPVGAAAMAFAMHLQGIVGTDVPTELLAILAIVLMTVVHGGAVVVGARIQVALTSLKVVLIGGFIVAGFLLGRGDVAHFSMVASGGAVTLSAFATSLVFVSFAYTGWNAAVYLGGEAKQPARDLPRAILFGVAAVVAIYLSLNFVFIYALAPSALAGHPDAGRLAAHALFGPRVGGGFALAIALFLLSTIGAMTMTGPRVIVAMARDGAFFAPFAKLGARTQAPLRALLLQSAIAVAMVLTATFEALLLYVGFVLSLFSSLSVLGLMRLRRRSKTTTGSDVFRTWGYPVTPMLFVVLNLGIVAFSVKDNLVAFLSGVATLVVGHAVARLRTRRPRA